MDAEPDFSEIERLYEIVFSELLSEGDKIYLGSGGNKTCRFCGLSDQETTFQKIAHAVPESLGNKRLILRDECDECNKYFSETLEDSLDKFSKPFRTLFRIKGKKKIPSYKTNDKAARIDVDQSTISIGGDENIIFDPNDEKNIYTLKLHREPYRPLAVYKALVKIAVSTLPVEMLDNVRTIIEWLRFEKHQNVFLANHGMSQRFIPDSLYGPGLFVITFRRKAGVSVENPYLMLLVLMGSIAFQIGIPKEGEQVSQLILFPIPGQRVEGHSILNLSSNDLRLNEKVTFNMTQKREMEG